MLRGFAGDACTPFASVLFTLRMLPLVSRIASSSGRTSSCRNTCASVFPNFALVTAGDANVWLPYFRLNRQRSRDNAIFPYIQQLLDLGLTIINPQSRATHVAGAALDLVFVSTHLECDHFTVHQGDSCCVSSPACSSSLTSDHFLCTSSLRGDQRSFSPGGQSHTRSVFPQIALLVVCPPLRPRSRGFLG